MRTIAKSNVELAESLFKTIELRKELEKREAELKEQVKELMGEETILEAGPIFISFDERLRTDLDKKKMQQELGLELLKQFEKTSTFRVMQVIRK